MIVPSLGQLMDIEKISIRFQFFNFIYLFANKKNCSTIFIWFLYPRFFPITNSFSFHLFSLFSFFLFPFSLFPLPPVSLSIKNYFRIRLSLLLSLLSNSKIFIIYSKPFFPPFFYSTKERKELTHNYIKITTTIHS